MLGYLGKWAFKSLLMMALMLGVSSYLLYLRTGHTPWSLLGIHSWQDLTRKAAPEMNVQQLSEQVVRKVQALGDEAAAVLPDSLPAALTPEPREPQRVYRWVDAQGVTHFSETPPAGVSADTVLLSPDRNVIQSAGKQPDTDQKTRAPDTVEGVQKMVDEINQQRTQALQSAGE